jgi:hypothetical protein
MKHQIQTDDRQTPETTASSTQPLGIPEKRRSLENLPPNNPLNLSTKTPSSLEAEGASLG